jgi:serine protease Do
MIRNLIRSWNVRAALGLALVAAMAPFGQAQEPLTEAAAKVNQKMVKLFGIGGFKGLPSYGTGILVSSKGHILTVNNHILVNTSGILVHMYDGRQYQAKVITREPELDVALLKIDEDVEIFHYFDFDKEAARPLAENGDWIIALSNQFKIALRDEPMSLQRGAIATVADLKGRRGVFDAPFSGDVYFLDNITNNPGAAGGAIANLNGELLGIIGRELKDSRIETWINYAVPIQSVVEVQREEAGKTMTKKVNMAEFVRDGIANKYVQGTKVAREDKGGFHGMILVVDSVRATPPYIEEIVAGSPAAKAGMRPDDLILYVEGASVPTIKAFREELKQYEPGKEITVRFQRGNRLETVQLKLTAPPKNTAN